MVRAPTGRTAGLPAVLCLLAAGVVPGAGAPPAGWPTYHGDFSLSGVAGCSLPGKPARLWRVRIGGTATATPVSDGTLVFCANGQGEIRAVDMAGGIKWTAALKRPGAPATNANEKVSSPLTAAGGAVLAASASGNVYAFEAATGAPRWVYAAGENVQGCVNFAPGPGPEADRVFVMAQPSGALHAVDARTGRPAWVAPASARCDGSPGVNGPSVVYGSCAAGLHVVSADSGKQAAFIGLGEGREMAGGVALAGRRAFAGDRSGRLVCADIEAGTAAWSVECGEGEMFTTPAVAGDRVVLCAPDGSVRCLAAGTGRELWRRDTGRSPPLSPAIAGDKVVAAAGGGVYLLALEDGAMLWSAEEAGEMGSPAVVNGMILVGTDDGYLVAFGAMD